MAGGFRCFGPYFLAARHTFSTSAVNPRLCVRLRKNYQCHLSRCFSKSSLYDETFRRSIEEPEDFWTQAAEQLVWHKKWDKILDNSNPPFTKWYAKIDYLFYVCNL